MKHIAIFSDFEFDQIVPDMTDTARAFAWEQWTEDLNTTMSKEQLIVGANSIVYYFGSKVLLTDVDWSPQDNCFLWEVEQSN